MSPKDEMAPFLYVTTKAGLSEPRKSGLRVAFGSSPHEPLHKHCDPPPLKVIPAQLIFHHTFIKLVFTLAKLTTNAPMRSAEGKAFNNLQVLEKLKWEWGEVGWRGIAAVQ